MAFSHDYQTGLSNYTLTILLKSPMRGGLCYLGLEENTGKIFRLCDEDGRFVWSHFSVLKLEHEITEEGLPWLEVGRRYDFIKADTVYVPRFYEDICVLPQCTRSVKEDPSRKDLYGELLSGACESVEKVFDYQVKGDKYVTENCTCPAFGIWKFDDGDIVIYMLSDEYRDQQKRISLAGYDFPYKGSYHCGRIERKETDEPFMIVLGLSHPFAGSEDGGFNPKRCYIMVFGILSNDFEQSPASVAT